MGAILLKEKYGTHIIIGDNNDMIRLIEMHKVTAILYGLGETNYDRAEKIATLSAHKVVGYAFDSILKPIIILSLSVNKAAPTG